MQAQTCASAWEKVHKNVKHQNATFSLKNNHKKPMEYGCLSLLLTYIITGLLLNDWEKLVFCKDDANDGTLPPEGLLIIHLFSPMLPCPAPVTSQNVTSFLWSHPHCGTGWGWCYCVTVDLMAFFVTLDLATFCKKLQCWCYFQFSKANYRPLGCHTLPLQKDSLSCTN